MTDTAARPPRPRIIEVGAGLLALSGVAVLAAAGSLFTVRDWLIQNIHDANVKAKAADPANFPAYVHKIAVSQLIVAAILAAMLLFIARMALQGRSIARWAALGLYVLCFLTNTLLSYTSILSVAASEPLIFKVPSFIGAVAFVAAVVVINLKPSTEWLNWGRPASVRRGGLFAPRPPANRRRASQPPTVDVDPVAVRTAAPERSRPTARTKAGSNKSAAKSRRS